VKAWRAIIAVAAALVFGYVTGFLGTIIQHRNESTFGGSSRQYRFEWLVWPAAPGFILAELRAGYDWRVDEAWSFRKDIRFWNAAFWSGVVFVVTVPLVLRRGLRNQSASRETGLPIRYEF
jgi:hypothetical protein